MDEFSYLSVPHRCPLRPNALGVAGSSGASLRLFSQPLQSLDHLFASIAKLLVEHAGQVFDQLLAFGSEVNMSLAPISLARFTGNQF